MPRIPLPIAQLGGAVVAAVGALLLMPLGWWLVLVGLVTVAVCTLLEQGQSDAQPAPPAAKPAAARRADAGAGSQ